MAKCNIAKMKRARKPNIRRVVPPRSIGTLRRMRRMVTREELPERQTICPLLYNCLLFIVLPMFVFFALKFGILKFWSDFSDIEIDVIAASSAVLAIHLILLSYVFQAITEQNSHAITD